MLIDHGALLQVGAIVAPLMATGLVAWNHLSNKVGRVEEQMRAQNGRIGRLEEGVVYQDTFSIIQKAADANARRVEMWMTESRTDRRGLSEQMVRLQEEMATRTGEIARMLEETRTRRLARGLPEDYPEKGV